MDMLSIKNNKYKNQYKMNDVYWGLGIENETYFSLESDIEKKGSYIKKNRRRERYSIDYNNNYDQEKLLKYLNKLFLDTDIYKIPQYINSHTLTKTDIYGEHQTLYSADRRDNPKFVGKTLYEELKKHDDIFSRNYDNTYVFDGDTVEFITQKFYKTTVEECISELGAHKKEFLDSLNHYMILNNLPKYIFPSINYGLVQYKTNQSNVSVFNNGTYHINITLPTKLDDNGNIANMELFEKQHKNAIRLLQWIEPLIISIYGRSKCTIIIGMNIST